MPDRQRREFARGRCQESRCSGRVTVGEPQEHRSSALVALDQLNGVDVPRYRTEYAPRYFDLGVVGDADVVDQGSMRVLGPCEIAVSVRRPCDTAAMANPFGMLVRFTAQPGQGDALAAMLLEAADGVRSLGACQLYIVSRVPADDETVWVTEAWTDREAHDASLKDEQAQALIKRAMPLLAGPPETIELRPAGGKGL